MSNDFEKNISQRIDGFQLSPGPQVWERVAAALPEKRRRRFAIWWWLPLAACLCGGVWLMIDRQKSADDKRITGVARSTAAEDSNHKKLTSPPFVDTTESDLIQQNDKPKDLLTKKQNGVQHTADVNKKEDVANYYSKKSKQPGRPLQAGNLMVTPKVENSGYKNVLSDRPSQTSPKQTEEIDYILNHAAENAAIQKAIISDSNLLGKESILPLVDLTLIPSPEIITKKDTAVINDNDTLLRTSAGNKTPEAKTKNKQAEWGLTVAIGKSSLNDGNSDMLKSTALYNSVGSGGLTSGGQAGNTGTFSNPTGGISFNAGISRNQIISKHFSWQAELNYQLLTARQLTGSRNDSLANADKSADDAFYTTNRIGSSASAVQLNRVHRLQILSGIRYTFNPQANSPISLFAGVSIAYNISNNLLLHDYRSGSYIRSAALSNKLMLGAQTGLDVFINHKIHAGLSYQHDFTNVARAKVGSVFRWNQLQLRIAIPLSKH